MTSSDLLPPPPPTSPGAASGTTQHRPCSHLRTRNTLYFRKLYKTRWRCDLKPFTFYVFYLLRIKDFTVPASSVLVFTDTGLGSPTPTLFLAKTRNSYSTQALRSTTVAVSVFPSIISGTGKKQTHFIHYLLNTEGIGEWKLKNTRNRNILTEWKEKTSH